LRQEDKAWLAEVGAGVQDKAWLAEVGAGVLDALQTTVKLLTNFRIDI
jgi:hypothetical protein